MMLLCTLICRCPGCGLAVERLSATSGVPTRTSWLAKGCGNHPPNLLALFGRHENRVGAFRRDNGGGERINGDGRVAHDPLVVIRR
jgi:hypothetical protein